MNYNQSEIRVYPSSNARSKSYKLNSERNLTSLVNSQSRNRIISGFDMSISGNTININPGRCIINGYQITVNTVKTIAKDSTNKSMIFLKLVRESSGDYNLQGTATTSDELYIGLSYDKKDGKDASDTYDDIYAEILATYDPTKNESEDDILVLGCIDGTKVYQSKIKSNLRAQDIWVSNNDTDVVPDDSSENPEYDALNKGARLDSFLANYIISDGQF